MEIQLSTREAAAAIGRSVRTAQRWAATGKLTAVKQGGRWQITVAADVEGYKPFQLDKARQLIEDGGIVPSLRRPGIWTVASSDGTTTYLVHRDVCSCPAGQRGRACYHRAAVALLQSARTAA
jgi:excisionase family DNA binding protein